MYIFLTNRGGIYNLPLSYPYLKLHNGPKNYYKWCWFYVYCSLKYYAIYKAMVFLKK